MVHRCAVREMPEFTQTVKGGNRMKKVLVLEDETSIRSFVVINLKRAGYEPIEAGTGAEAFEQLKANPDIKVAILDIMLPDIDGFEVCRKIRAADPHIGIIMLTARTQEMDKVTGLMTGADDYVTKPFSPAELTARIDALYRRTGGSEQIDTGEIVQGPFRLNTRNRTLEKNGVRIKLTQVEYAIMKMFMDNPGKALSREDILNTVWGRDYFGELKIADVNIRRLRIKIEDDPTNPSFITTVWGYGYKWGL
jgi:DNA-binding response OmpR family regulator